MIEFLLCFAAGLALGGIVAWLLAAARASAGRIEAETRLAEAAKNIEEQKGLLEESKKALSDHFGALAGAALKSNNEVFLALAGKSIETVMVDAKGDLEKRQQAIDGLVKPLQESLKKYDEQARQIELAREGAYKGLRQQIEGLTELQQQLRKETGNLVTALRRPEVRGRWGEMTLRRVVELAGMSAHCDFTEQPSVTSEEGRLRPDMIVHLPAGCQVVVDSKVSLDAYLDAVSADSEEKRAASLKRHAEQVRSHMNSLRLKSYWSQFDPSPEFVVMFIPGESFFSAAVDLDRSLIEDGMEKKVVLATPTTLIALLRAVAYGWRQEQIAQNAREISALGAELYDRLRTLAGHFERMRDGLEKANRAYSDAVGSMQSRVFVAARKFKEMGAGSGEDIPTLEPIESTPRELRLPEQSEEA